MKSIRKIYRIGRGPSSSHSMAPARAAQLTQKSFPEATHFEVILYGSLAKTGRGHMTDLAICDAFNDKPCNVVFDRETKTAHPNTMDFFAYKNNEQLGKLRILSIGGGSIRVIGKPNESERDIYPHSSMGDIIAYCKAEGLRLWEYVQKIEGEDIFYYLSDVWEVMLEAVRTGLLADGVLPGELGIRRKANLLYKGKTENEPPETAENRLVCAYAFAVSEQNASMGTIVTAPTCGACGVLPAVLKYEQEKNGYSDEEILHALATAGLFGNIIKANASISGAECGCQAEIGSACSMAAAALAELKGLGLEQIEYSAEVAMEHHLGLTCDPVVGLVQIPCIERNAVAAMRAINAVSIATFLTHTRKVSFDTVVSAMYATGKDMHRSYRETSEGGLAVKYIKEERTDEYLS